MKNTLDGGPSVSDSNWWVVSISQQIVNQFPGMCTRSASCLKNERDQIAVKLSMRTQEVDCEGNKGWAVVHQSIAREMLSCLDNSEALKVGTKELKEQILSPIETNEISVDIEHIV